MLKKNICTEVQESFMQIIQHKNIFQYFCRVDLKTFIREWPLQAIEFPENCQKFVPGKHYTDFQDFRDNFGPHVALRYHIAVV